MTWTAALIRAVPIYATVQTVAIVGLGTRQQTEHTMNVAEAGNAKDFAIAFTIAVTETSASRREFIAKNGKDSIFAVLQEIYPSASSSYCCP
jgi:hypothetical protein